MHPKTLVFLRVFLAVILIRSGASAAEATFVENLGQWDNRALFKTNLSNGSFFLENDGFTYSLLDLQVYRDAHNTQSALPQSIKGHAFKMTFDGANPIEVNGIQRSSHYKCFFLGNDPSKWKTHVGVFGSVNYEELYPGIDLNVYSKNGNLKYDLLISPNANINDLKLTYEGVDSLELLPNGDLEIFNSVADLTEKKPIAYQIINGQQVLVKCDFKLVGNSVSFVFPEGYDRSKELTIDPELVFASYSASTADNFGSTATYDNVGNLYGAGTAFGAGYPISVGAYTQPALGNTDIGVSKFSSDGTSLIYSAIIGGSASESVQSIVVNANNELCIFGGTASSDYPVSANAYQPTTNGGPAVSWTNSISYGVGFALGCDIVITKLEPDGSAIAASTYLGGTHNDGINPNSVLNYNYGDPFRGEINIDPAGNIYLATSSESTDFPTTAGAVQTTLNGARDAVVCKLSPDLSTLIWSTYLGGSQHDNAYSIQVTPNGEILVAGGTLSSNFPTSPNALFSTQRGQADGWVAKISNNGNSLLASTYIGTGQYDQVYFVQYDSNDDVFILGQSVGPIPITPADVYHNPNSGQFIQKLDNGLSTLLVSTTIGTGSGEIDFSPTAFLISNCNQIYLSGWGGPTNDANDLANQSTTNGLPVTSDAFQGETDGKDFYLMVLQENAQDLAYATFFGGTSGEHVDGGTSRFDKNGVVYQAVCAGCGGSDNFPTTPDAWSQENGSSNCNLGVFKFDLNRVLSLPEIDVQLGNCEYPVEVQFTNNSSGANSFYWEYGDGTTATVFEEPHLYDEPGFYEVVLIAIDSLGCLNPDTERVEFEIPAPPIIEALGSDTICSNDTIPLTVIGDDVVSYTWRPTEGIDDFESANPLVNPLETTTYTVIVTDENGCQSSDEVQVFVSIPPGIEAGSDAYTEPGNPAQLLTNLPEEYTFEWSPPEGLSCTTCQDPIADPLETTTYYLEVTDELGCSALDSLVVIVYPTLYAPNAFTPGPNTHNPVFYLYGQGITDFNVEIFTRWGQKVYESESILEGWDGTFNNGDAPQGVYVWRVTYTTDITPGRTLEKIGHVTLLRDMD